MKKWPVAISREPAEPEQPTKWTGRTLSLTALRVLLFVCQFRPAYDRRVVLPVLYWRWDHTRLRFPG